MPKQTNELMMYGAKNAIEDCLKVKEGEDLVIIADKETLGIGDALRDAAEKITRTVGYYVLEDFVKNTKDATKCPEAILDAVKKADVSIYCASMKWYKWNSSSIVNDILRAIPDKKGVRHARMPGITKEIMETGMCADYSEVRRLSKKLYSLVKNATEIITTTEKGTYLTAKFDLKPNWHFSDSSFRNKVENLPTGDMSAPVKHIKGKLVIDGYIGAHLNNKYGEIERTPIEIEIKGNKVVENSIKCDNKSLRKEFHDYIFRPDKNSSRIGAFMIGTNMGLEKVVGNLLQDEKLPGAHVLFGSPSYFPLNKWSSKVICDCWIKNTTLLIDGKKVMAKGVFLI